MTVNAYIFSWDITGVEAIVPISSYENWDTENAFRALEGKAPKDSPLNSILGQLKLRAQYNPQRFYEIYAVDCDSSMTPSWWSRRWEEDPQFCADLIREKGVHIWGSPMPKDSVRIR